MGKKGAYIRDRYREGRGLLIQAGRKGVGANL